MKQVWWQAVVVMLGRRQPILETMAAVVVMLARAVAMKRPSGFATGLNATTDPLSPTAWWQMC